MTYHGSTWLLTRESAGRTLWTSGGKRAFDALAAGLLLLLLSPLLIGAGLAVCLTSRGGPVYRQTRIGRDRQAFVMFKFRTMRAGSADDIHRDYVRQLLTADQPPNGGEQGMFKLGADHRVTAVGRFLRRSSIDELPQLVNVLAGQMSLVGPRPALDYEAELFPASSDARFRVRPGLTGLWQVSGRSRIPMLEGLALDVDYVRQQSMRADLTILLRTVWAVLRPGSAR